MSEFYKKNRGFTLVELLVVVLIVGVLAALGLPQFMKTKEHALGKEAMANLKLIAAAQKIYRLESYNNQYYPIPAGPQSDISVINSYLRLSITNATSRNWDYTINTTGTPTSNYTSTATRYLGSGTYANCTYTINSTVPSSLEEPVKGTYCP